MNEQPKLAVLIDAENVSNKYVKLIMDEVSNYGVATYKRVYGDYSNPSVSAWMKNMQEYALTPELQCNYTAGKSASDSALIIDAMDILYSGKVSGFCLVSSDSDFTKLAMRLKEAGMMVIGMGEEKTPKSFVNACENFKYLDLLYNKEEAEEKQRTATTRRNTNASSEKDAGDNDNLPKLSDIEKEVISIIRSNAEENGWINISELGINLSKRIPGFDPRNYQFLYLTGYLTMVREKELQEMLPDGMYALTIPNAEIREIFETTVKVWFDDSAKGWDRKALFEAVWTGDCEKAGKEMNQLLRMTISYHDYREDFYHAFLAGIFAGAGYMVESNKEHGEGRSDVIVFDSRNGRVAVFEAKYSRTLNQMEPDCEKAIRQIDARKYAEEFEDYYDEVLCYGISFYKKRCLIKRKER